jgi:hypothetical protein
MARPIRINKPFVTRLPGAYRPHKLAKLDKRTREARRMRQIEADLFEHVGGVDRATAPQKYLIERTAIDIVRLELLDTKMTNGSITEYDARISHALRGAVRLALRQLGAAVSASKPADALGYAAHRAKGKAA